jgi:hypothetical protein
MLSLDFKIAHSWMNNSGYLLPVMENGVLIMIILDKLNSSKQKYRKSKWNIGILKDLILS